MKKKVRQYAQQIESGTKNRRQIHKEFSRMLDDQVWSCIYTFGIETHVTSCISRMLLLAYMNDLTMILNLIWTVQLKIICFHI